MSFSQTWRVRNRTLTKEPMNELGTTAKLSGLDERYIRAGDRFARD